MLLKSQKLNKKLTVLFVVVFVASVFSSIPILHFTFLGHRIGP